MSKMRQCQKIEFGDFQTPIELTEIIVRKLINLGIDPDIVIEPSCGTGNFILSAANYFKSTSKIIGIEINPIYLEIIENNKIIKEHSNIILLQDDFFEFQWSNLIDNSQKNLLVLGNFPWVTNAKQGAIKSNNLPKKTNFQKHKGLAGITGNSNFDISEWMLIKTIQWLQRRNSYLAMLCKTSVARKVLNYINKNKLQLTSCATYDINTHKYFQANVSSCLLFCDFTTDRQQYTCKVFPSIDSKKYYEIGYYQNTLVRDINTFNSVSSLFTKQNFIKWRSGIKHDCCKVMELQKIEDKFVNGFGEVFDLENNYIYPLLKGSDIANGRTKTTDRYVLVTQNNIGQSTNNIKQIAPKTWNYLLNYSHHLDNRKSKIYRNKPRFSVFGVGDYSFMPWKIAICGLYKNLGFKLIREINNKPTFFDDTVYFIGFSCRETAELYFNILNNKKILVFYSSLIFWDEKRPIKASILNSLNLEKAKAQYELS